MKTALKKGLSGESLKHVMEEYRAGAAFREQLSKLLEQKIKVNRRAVVSQDAYEKAGWPYLQADAVGYERALLEVISLITEKSVE